MHNNRIPMLILPLLPNTQYTPPAFPLRNGYLLILTFRGSHTLILTFAMIIMHQNILPILILSTLPHTQDTASPGRALGAKAAFLGRAGDGGCVGSCGGGDQLEFSPYGGAAALPVCPGVFFVRHDGPVLLVLAVLVDLGEGAVGWDAACPNISFVLLERLGGRDVLKSSPSRIDGSTIVIAGVLLVDILLYSILFSSIYIPKKQKRKMVYSAQIQNILLRGFKRRTSPDLAGYIGTAKPCIPNPSPRPRRSRSHSASLLVRAHPALCQRRSPRIRGRGEGSVHGARSPGRRYCFAG